MNLRAGFIAAVGWGVLAGVSAFVLVAAADAIAFWEDLAVRRVYRPWLTSVLYAAFFPVLGSAVVFASAAWATYAPPGRHRLTMSAGWCFLGSLTIWWLISLASGPQLKSLPDPDVLLQLLFLVVPPVLCSAGLTVSRCLEPAK